MAVVDRPTTTTDAGGWSESPDQGTPDTPVTSPQTGTNGLDATGQAIQPEEANETNEPPRRPDGSFEKNGFRRRAASQQATAEDVPRIRELTRKLRDAERERDTLRNGGVPPVAAGTAREGAPGPGTAPQAGAPPSPRPRQALPPPPPAFTLQEPTYDQFADSPDPHRDYMRALAKFTNLEEQHAQATRWYEQQHQRAGQASQVEMRAMTQAHWNRMNEAAKDPANAPLIAQFKNDPRPITPAILQAVIRSGENSHKLTLALLRQPGLLEELTLATYDKPATPDLVAVVQRRLQSLGLSAAATGSATAPVSRPAPRPPNPVRTAPDGTAEGTPRRRCVSGRARGSVSPTPAFSIAARLAFSPAAVM